MPFIWADLATHQITSGWINQHAPFQDPDWATGQTIQTVLIAQLKNLRLHKQASYVFQPESLHEPSLTHVICPVVWVGQCEHEVLAVVICLGQAYALAYVPSHLGVQVGDWLEAQAVFSIVWREFSMYWHTGKKVPLLNMLNASFWPEDVPCLMQTYQILAIWEQTQACFVDNLQTGFSWRLALQPVVTRHAGYPGVETIWSEPGEVPDNTWHLEQAPQLTGDWMAFSDQQLPELSTHQMELGFLASPLELHSIENTNPVIQHLIWNRHFCQGQLFLLPDHTWALDCGQLRLKLLFPPPEAEAGTYYRGCILLWLDSDAQHASNVCVKYQHPVLGMYWKGRYPLYHLTSIQSVPLTGYLVEGTWR